MNRYDRPEAVLQVGEQLQDLGLDRDVERRYRLVEHEQAWLDGQRPGDRDPLALAAAELVREARDGVAGQPD